jgi:hypothetical protein
MTWKPNHCSLYHLLDQVLILELVILKEIPLMTKTQHIGPMPIEKNATFPQTAKIARSIPTHGDISPMACFCNVSATPKRNKHAVMPMVLT